jgi:hypothetical protein
MKLQIPSVEEYKNAFENLEPEISADELKMLKANYDAPERTITAEIMSEAMNYASFGGANLQYGKLGGKLCRYLNLNPKFKIEVLCDFIAPKAQGDNVHWLWVMRPEVAQALKELGWV